MYDIVELNGKLVAELRQIAKEFDIPKPEKLLKKDLIYKILDHQALNPTKEVLEAEKNPRQKEEEKGFQISLNQTRNLRVTSKKVTKRTL